MSAPPLDLPALQRVVEKAAKGPWRHTGGNVVYVGDDALVYVVSCDDGMPHEQDAHDATFIATFNPETVGALLGEVRGLRADNAMMAGELTRAENERDVALDRLYAHTERVVCSCAVPEEMAAAGHEADCESGKTFMEAQLANVIEQAEEMETELARLRRVEAAAQADHEGHRIEHVLYDGPPESDGLVLQPTERRVGHAATEPCPLPADDEERCKATCAVCDALTGEPPARSGEG